ncbi:ataxin-7 isoform X1 [Polypterus senegalus]|uniref:ataxin-7 isoform X1 n=1 Tax=Polypterus senegalus TaxID=55291 RepID=UPI001963A194|nr:ataxin-7 isoform X1 [Polypterus senegalus]XP_039626662.1 ataxin-7 isoform X1 [Polypterus senegalus]XP_039626664.1 ataxin-7 isoform X1 [Polypterus senegalus]
MSERADDDVRGEQRRAARQLKQQQQLQQGEGSTAMATVGERRALHSPEILLGQPWSSWVDASKQHGSDGAEPEESLKEWGKNREAMRLCREDMPIFGHCPAQDDFYLVMCNHCNQVVKPQAFQAHYERRHSSSSNPPLTPTPTSAYSLASTLPKKTVSSYSTSRPPAGNSSSTNSKSSKFPKEKLHGNSGSNRPMHLQHTERIMTPPVKAEKMHQNPKVDGTSLKTVPGSTVSSSIKPGLNCPSIPKPPMLSPGQIPNGKGPLSTPDKKQDDNASSKKQLYKRLPEREFNPDIHCGVVDQETRKTCTRSLTCKAHSLSQRRAVLGRRKRFDLLLAEHKSKTRDKDPHRASEHASPATPLREPHPPTSRATLDMHPNSHGSASESKLSTPNKPRSHNPSLPRSLVCPTQGVGNVSNDLTLAQESPHHSTPAVDVASRLSSDEGENEEEPTEKLDCHYSGYHPRPAAICTFGSRHIGRGCYVFDRRWERIRCALNSMVDKYVNSQMWKKIPPASENSMSTPAPHRTSTNSLPMLHCSVNATGYLCSSPVMSPPVLVSPPYTQACDNKSILSYGTTLNAHSSPMGSSEQTVYTLHSRQVSSSPQMPSGHSAVTSSVSSKPQKSKSSSKSFRSKESPATVTNCNSNSSAKKRKSSSPLPAYSSSHSAETASYRKNCALNSGGSGSSYHSFVPSSAHSSVHNASLNCTNKANSLGLRHDQSGRGPPSGSPAESIKRMSVVMNSSDSTLSLGPFVHQSVEQSMNSHANFSHSHVPIDKLEGKKRKGSPASSSINSTRPTKMAKSPTVNNIHTKHTRAIPGTQGLPSNSLLQQPKARP